MMQVNEDTRQKEQRNLFSIVTQSKIGFAKENARKTYDIAMRLFFLTILLLFSININKSLKSKDLKTKDTALYYNFNVRANDAKKGDFISERYYLANNSYTYPKLTLNPFLFLYSSQIYYNQHKIIFLYNTYINQISYKINNAQYILSFLENIVFMGASQDKSEQNKLENLLTNIENDNNLEKYKEKKLNYFIKVLSYETLLDKIYLYIPFTIYIFLIIIKVVIYITKRREEKRR